MRTQASQKKVTFRPDEVYEWLERQAKRRHLRARVYDKIAQLRDGVLVVPLWLEVRGLSSYLQKLQAIENAWNNPEPPRSPRLFLVPASKDSVPHFDL